MGTIVRIEDDFSLPIIMDSGQCFRCIKVKDDVYRFVKGDSVLYIRRNGNKTNEYEISTSEAEWKDKWQEYFDLGRDYGEIRKSVPSDDKFLKNAVTFGKGIRILRQEPWEMLISFIISQRKSIPAIRKSVEDFSKMFGTPVDTEYERVYLFPTVEQAQRATEDDLVQCKLGYRVRYVLDAIRRVGEGTLNLEEAGKLGDAELLEELMTVNGVGVKVANCVGLFAYARFSLAPIDTWIQKIITNEYNGVSPFDKYGDIAGIMQQYMFYYMTQGPGRG